MKTFQDLQAFNRVNKGGEPLSSRYLMTGEIASFTDIQRDVQV